MKKLSYSFHSEKFLLIIHFFIFQSLSFALAQTPSVVSSKVPNLTAQEDAEAHTWVPLMKQFVHETNKPIRIYNWAPKKMVEEVTGRTFENNKTTLQDYISKAQSWFWKLYNTDPAYAIAGSGLYLAADPWISTIYSGDVLKNRILTQLEFKSHTKYFSYIQSNLTVIGVSDIPSSWDPILTSCMLGRSMCSKPRVLNRALELLEISFIEYNWLSVLNKTEQAKINPFAYNFGSAFVLADSQSIDWSHSQLIDSNLNASDTAEILKTSTLLTKQQFSNATNYSMLRNPFLEYWDQDVAAQTLSRTVTVLDVKKKMKDNLKKFFFLHYNTTQQELNERIEEIFK